MSRTITALFDRRSDAEAAEARLKQSNVDAGHIRIHDQASAGYSGTDYSTNQEPGMWASIRNAFLPDEDRHTYEEGVRRGGYVLTADVSDEQVDDAVRVLEEADTVDIDERSRQWREGGWDYQPGMARDAMARDVAVPAGTGLAGGEMATPADPAYAFGTSSAAPGAAYAAAAYDDTAYDADEAATARTAAGTGDEQVIPVVEEELVVGKREVDRGGARVRSYVTERPVHEQVRLRDERVDVQRRAVDRPVTDAEDAFRERTIDVTATGEEAVVSKDARVVEEVVVSKTAGERVEQIDDTVRRTEVEVDRDPRTDTDPTTR